MHYSLVNNEKKTRAPSHEHVTFGQLKTVNDFRKLIKYFKYFCMKFTLFFRFFDSCYIINYLLAETSGKQYVLWTLNCGCFDSLGSAKHTVSLGLGQ